MKSILLAALLASLSVPTFAAPKGKPAPSSVKAPCAEDVCLKLHQEASMALAKARTDVILLREEEYRKNIPSALEAMMEKSKAARQEINEFYAAATRSASGSRATTTALKNYMKIWTAAINA